MKNWTEDAMRAKGIKFTVMGGAPAPAVTAAPRKSKYGAVRIECDGYVFDSIGEKERYDQLKLQERAGVISNLSVHPRFPLRSAGEEIAEIELDYAYTEKDQRVVEDFKGVLTRVFRLKRKMFLAQYRHIELRVTNRKGEVLKVRTRKASKLTVAA